MSTVVNLLLGVLGLGAGTSPTQKVGGVANWVLGVPLLVYLIAHADQQINFETSLGFLALVCAVALLVLELQRRS